MLLSHRPATALGARRPRSLTVKVECNGVRARWQIDSRYGCKTEATLLLQEWVRDVGSQAGLNNANTRLASGAIGAPESRLELEVAFESLSDWERFLGSIPFKDHKAWSQRIQSMVTSSSSPKWEVFRVVPVDVETDATAPAAPAAAMALVTSGASKQPLQLVLNANGNSNNNFELLTYSDDEEPPSPRVAQQAEASEPANGLTVIEGCAAAEFVLVGRARRFN